MADRLVWVDLEMTGLDPAKDVILEIAALVTTGDLEPVGDGVDLVVSQPKDALDAMVDVVKEMHASSGLTDAVLASTTTVADAEAAVLAHIREHVPNPRQAPLCGNSIGTDRGFLARYMPELDSALHYRMVDVSSIKELCRRWYPRIYQEAPAKAGGHRALADIKESVEELRYYRSTIFLPKPEQAATGEGGAVSTEPAPNAPNPGAGESLAP